MRRLGGRFVLEREIGAGGMSVVFLGRDEVLDRPVAVKVLRSGFEGSEVSTRFRREGRTAARLSHPNIVPVYDAGEGEFEGHEVSYIVMEYLLGGDLKGLIDENGPLSEKELARMGADVASGLTHAHEKGIIHRDIKPQNVLIDGYGNSKLADFGVARALDATQATGTGSYLGTAAYSSPEQLRGEEITTKSDVYSLGCTLYQASVGEPPFSGGPIEVASQQLTRSPAPPRARGASMSESFETLVLSCLAKDPVDRPNADGLQERLLRASAAASDAMATTSDLGGETLKNFGQAAWEIGAASVSEMSGAAKVARAVGERGLETVAQEVSARVDSAGDSERTLIVSHRDFVPGRNRWMLLAAGAALLLLALIAVGAYMLLSNTGEEADQLQDIADIPADPVSSESTPPPVEAEQAVYDMYVQGSYRNIDASREYLSQRMQEDEGSRERWAERFNDVWYVYFTQYPEAEVSGERVRVAFKLRETHSAELHIITGTWVGVNEGGEWKLDHLEDEEIEYLY